MKQLTHINRIEWKCPGLSLTENTGLCLCNQTENAGYELERLHSEVTSLCSRIELLPCSTARDRLAQSGRTECGLWRHLYCSSMPECAGFTEPIPPCRNGQARGEHPAGSTEPAAEWRGSRQHPPDPAGATHHSPAHARGLRAGWAARPHTVIPAAAHRQFMSSGHQMRRSDGYKSAAAAWTQMLIWSSC